MSNSAELNTKKPAGRRSVGEWLSLIAISILIIIGVVLAIYPTVGNWWNQLHASRAIAGYAHAVETIEEKDYAQILEAARAYNEKLKTDKGRFTPSEEDTAYYNTLLDVAGNGIMGYVDIPCIEVSLPIYHGTSESVLQVAAGHIEGSSLPIGGPGTHVALSGHRGLTSAQLFTHLDRMKEGDMFHLHILDQIMSYQVDQIVTVLPEEMDDLAIDESEDYCTLVTCTPYGVNSHRLLVRGTRVETPEDYLNGDEEDPLQPTTHTSSGPKKLTLWGLPLWVPLPPIVGLFVIINLFKRPKPKKKKTKE